MIKHILFVLDKSGSMVGNRQATISGFNEYLTNIKQDDEVKDARFSLVMFDTTFKEVYNSEKLENVKELSVDTYVPSGLTALYDAVGHMLASTKDSIKKKHRTLVVIQTDGEENSSKEYDQKKIFNLIKSYEDKGNYTFVFIGCGQDSWGEATQLGTRSGNTLKHDGTEQSTSYAYEKLHTGTRKLSRSVSMSTDTFWQDTD